MTTMDSLLTVLRYLRGLPIVSPNLLCTPTTYHMIPQRLFDPTRFYCSLFLTSRFSLSIMLDRVNSNYLQLPDGFPDLLLQSARPSIGFSCVSVLTQCTM